MVASEIDEKVGGVQKTLEQKIAALEAKLAERDNQALERERAEYEASAVRHVQQNAEKYPAIHAFEVVGNIPAVISAHFNDTLAATGQGELWSPEQAATAMETALRAKAEAASKAIAPKAATPPAAPGAQRTPQPQRRTLSTDLTASSTGQTPPPLTPEQRLERAVAAWDRTVAARTAH
jgi:hypothetical protein